MRPLRIGSRGSILARWQAEFVRKQLFRVTGVEVEIIIIKTSGDKLQQSPLTQIGGKGIFIKELEEALLDETVDLAVHSVKDIPTETPGRLFFPAVCRRDDVRDCLVSSKGTKLANLRQGARVGTGSLRRKAQLRHHRPDLDIRELRGSKTLLLFNSPASSSANATPRCFLAIYETRNPALSAASAVAGPTAAIRTCESRSASETLKCRQRCSRARNAFWLVRNTQSVSAKFPIAWSSCVKSSGGANISIGKKTGTAPPSHNALNNASLCSAARVTTTRFPTKALAEALPTGAIHLFQNLARPVFHQ